ARQLQLAAFVLDLAKEPKVLDCNHRLVGEGFKERDLLLGKGADKLPPHEDRAYGPAFPQHWRKDDRLVSNDHGTAPRVIGNVAASLDVGVVYDSAAHDGGPGAGLRCQWHRKVALQFLTAAAVVCREMNRTVIAHNVDPDIQAGEQPLAAPKNDLEHRLGVRYRAADYTQHLGSRLLLVEGLLDLIEQPHILDRDHRLVAKGCRKFDLSARERRHCGTRQREDTDGHSFSQQRNSQQRAKSGNFLSFRISIFRISQDIRDMYSFAF